MVSCAHIKMLGCWEISPPPAPPGHGELPFRGGWVHLKIPKVASKGHWISSDEIVTPLRKASGGGGEPPKLNQTWLFWALPCPWEMTVGEKLKALSCLGLRPRRVWRPCGWPISKAWIFFPPKNRWETILFSYQCQVLNYRTSLWLSHTCPSCGPGQPPASWQSALTL